MAEPLPDPRLRRALQAVDDLKKELRTERIKTGNLQARLAKATRTNDSAPKQREQRPRC